MNRRVIGLTLVELMVVLAMMAVVTSLAAPSFRSLWVKRSVLLAAEALLGDLRYARSEALKRGRPVLLCQSSNGTTCSQDRAGWADGWLVFVDSNAAGPAKALLRVQSTLPALATIVSNVSTGHGITYQATGSAKSAAQTILFTPAGSESPDSIRALCISLQGRARVGSAGATSCS
ncbi:MAG: GspH/FimT family pseudopilin [Polaromonas sp.]|nr:GspH/FimT family pseudopilin [Polaromonas sp.]